jgi:TRAP transporter 4TM/12TM fusion protein
MSMDSADAPTVTSKPDTVAGIEDVEVARYRKPGPFWTGIIFAMTLLAIGLAVNEIFQLGLLKLASGTKLLQNQYIYVLAGLAISTLFLVLPAHARAPHDHVPWYDVVLCLTTLGIAGYLAWHGLAILEESWEYNAPISAKYLAVVMWAIVLEAGRRAGGIAVLILVTVISLYPTYVEHMPGVFSGVGQTFLDTAAYHIFSEESLLGIPMQAFALTFFGFLLFGSALVYTGGGKFFINIAFALLGHVRGGPAKVAIFSSGLFGSMSGGPITNVLTTGTLTIPAMKRIGISAKTAGAIEACASTGGTMMPPIMGATAFVMANFLQVSYTSVAIAATVPSLLFYIGLFMQIDAYSAQNNLRGLEKSELPSLREAILGGWYYLAVFALLVFMLIFLKRESHAPFYATALLLVINQFDKKHHMRWADFKQYVFATGGLLAELAGVLAAVGLIVGALQATGMTGTLTNDLVFLAGNSPLVLLLMGALTSFILGMGMTVTAAYIFLAIILAPALIKVGLDPMGVHMFLLYWGMLSFITPPVALAAFAAASIARSKPMETGFEAMRIGTIIYFIPFFFVFNPALLLQGPWQEIGIVIATALVGILLVSAGLQGYLLGIGRLGKRFKDWVARLCLVIGGLAFAAPGGGLIGVSHLTLGLIAAGIAIPGILITWAGTRTARFGGISRVAAGDDPRT